GPLPGRHEPLAGPELVDVAENHVGHRVPGGDRDAHAVQGNGPARVERAVDRVDYHPRLGTAAAEGDLPEIRGNGGELVPGTMQPLQLREDRVLAEPVDDQGPVATLTDALVLGARGNAAMLGEDAPPPPPPPAAGFEPLLRSGAGAGGRLRGVAAGSCLGHAGEVSVRFVAERWRRERALAWS